MFTMARKSPFCRCGAAAGVFVAAIAGMAAAAETVSLDALKDNTLIQSNTGAASNALGDGIYSGRAGNNGAGVRFRAVIAFDVAAAIPPGSTINSASLTLHMVQTVSGQQSHTLHRLLGNWGEGTSSDPGGHGAPSTPGDATWIHRYFPDQLWAAAGGDFASVASAAQTIDFSGVPYTWTSFQMTADVQGWLDNPASNFGWLIRGNENSLNTAKKFASRHWAVVDERPVLTITYTPPTLPCPADIAPGPGDGIVDVQDLLAVINGWGGGPGHPADVDGSGDVDVGDLLAVINAWGDCP